MLYSFSDVWLSRICLFNYLIASMGASIGSVCFSVVQYLICLKCKRVKCSARQKDNHKVKVFPSQRQRKCTGVNITVMWLKPGMNVQAVYHFEAGFIQLNQSQLELKLIQLHPLLRPRVRVWHTAKPSIIRTRNQRTITTSSIHLIKMTSSR